MDFIRDTPVPNVGKAREIVPEENSHILAPPSTFYL
jgi:hypothetical protein